MIDSGNRIRFLPIHVINPQADKEKSIYVGEELESLISTLGGRVVDRVIQKLDNPDPQTFVGKGKAHEIAKNLKNIEVDFVVLNATAKPKQVHSLQEILTKESPEIVVWDRVDLILNIFEKHASTLEAKLQIDLARMKYMGPRIYGMGKVMSRQGGGIGTSGIGETNTELMKRHWRHEIKRVKDKLSKISNAREDQIQKRRRIGSKTVSIVGYTNAGKSTLFNLLTGKNNISENVLFATLDSAVGKMYLQEIQQEVLITDTIGFIRNLPPHLIDAFRSTLLESIHADILLHVIDASDPDMNTKIDVVKDILRELGINLDEVIFVFNKIDAVKDFDRDKYKEIYSSNYPVFISAKTGQGIDEIKKVIASKL